MRLSGFLAFAEAPAFRNAPKCQHVRQCSDLVFSHGRQRSAAPLCSRPRRCCSYSSERWPDALRHSRAGSPSSPGQVQHRGRSVRKERRRASGDNEDSHRRDRLSRDRGRQAQPGEPNDDLAKGREWILGVRPRSYFFAAARIGPAPFACTIAASARAGSPPGAGKVTASPRQWPRRTISRTTSL